MSNTFNRHVLTDLQQKVNYLQSNLNNQQPSGSSTGQQPVGSNSDSSVLNELRDTIRQIKSETNTLLQKVLFIKLKEYIILIFSFSQMQ